MNTKDGPSRLDVDPRSRAIAATLRAREIAKARAKEREAKARARETEKIRRRAKLHQATRNRVEIHRRAAETELIFRGPHMSTDLWLATLFYGMFAFLPVFTVGLFFPWIAALLTLLAVGPWLVVVYRPTRIVVTDLGYLEVRRWRRRIGMREQLTLNTESGRSNERFALECHVVFNEKHVWTAPRLTARDVAAVRHFEAMIDAEPERPEHEGGYRKAA